MNRRRVALVVVMLAAAALAWVARSIHHRRVELAGLDHWVTTDPDSLHQLRRIERIFREGPPAAEFDAELSWPEGSAIPAPPYYPLIAWSVLAPFAPRDAELRRGWLEERACMLPAVFGALAAALAALTAAKMLGASAGLFTGLCVAIAPGAIHYSCVGNGDYQSWSLLLGIAQLAVISEAFAGERMERPSSAIRWGVALGALHGVAIGSWTPALIQLVIADAALGVALFVHARTSRFAALAHFGLAMHAAALVALAPALWTSPWRSSEPWQVVNLSWFHAAYVALGAAVFAPLLSKRVKGAFRARYPWMVAAGLAVLFGVLVVSGVGPGAALREAFSWARADNDFMAQVAESAPLVGRGAWPKLFLYVGYGALLAPLLVPVFAWLAWRRAKLEWAAWCIALAVFGAMAAAQMRFAELVVAPLAVAMCAVFAELVARLPATRRLAGAAPLLAVVAALAFHAKSVRSTIARARSDAPFTDSLAKRSARLMAEWLRANSSPGEAVMAMWGYGQMIQWAAERPVVASNYGHYTGEQSFLDSFRFFASTDMQAAEALLERRDVRYVLITSEFDRNWPQIELALGEQLSTAARRESVGARLLGDGRPPDFLRVVHVSPLLDPRRAPPGALPPTPAGFVCERVAGARLEARGKEGDLLEVVIDLRAGDARFRYAVSARADSSGLAQLRVPYSSARAGDVELAAPMRARFAGATATVHVPEIAVREGRVVQLR